MHPIHLVRARSLASLLLLVGALAPLACSSSSSGAAAPPANDAGAFDAAVDAGSDAPMYPDVPEPPWSGMTVEPGCTANGCIHSFTKGDTFTQSVLSSFAAQSETVENGFTSYAITYVSDGAEIT